MSGRERPVWLVAKREIVEATREKEKWDLQKRESDKQMNGGPTVQRHGYLARC